MINTDTQVIDYIAQMKSISAENDIALLKSASYCGLFTIGTDNKLYAYNERTAAATQFERSEVYSDCQHFAACRMGGSDYFAIGLISNEYVYVCVTNHPESLTPASFSKLDFSGVLCGRNLVPVELFINGSDDEATMSVMMKNDGGRIDRFVAYFNINSPTTFKYFALDAGFDKIDDSFCGRADRQPVDGVYTLGTYGGAEQLLYTPIRNIFSSEPPNPIRLSIPEKGLNRIGICRLNDKKETHLFGIGGNTLFIYPYEKQHDCQHISYCNYESLVCSDLFYDPIKLSAYIDRQNNKLYVWVLNRSNTLSYTFAKISPDGKYTTFVEPIVCKRNIIFFDVTSDALTLCSNSELLFGTLGESGYSFNHINIKTDTGESTVMRAFSTKIVTENPCDSVRLTSDVPVEAYVNNIFYRFTNITVSSDAMGTVDVVQNADGINPLPFFIETVSADNGQQERLEYFSGKKCYDKLLELTTEDKIKSARITDIHGNQSGLASDLTDKQITCAAQTISSLAESYNLLCRQNGLSAYHFGNAPQSTDGIFDDLGYYLSEAWDYVCDKAKAFWDETLGKVIEFTSEIVSGIIKFVIKIGDEIITFLLDTVGKVLKCIVKVLEFIGIPVGKILDWLLAFLDIDGAVRMKTVMKYCAQKGFENLKAVTIRSKQMMIDKLLEAMKAVEKWADLDAGTIKPAERRFNPADMNSANMFIFDHILKQGNFLSVKMPIGEPPQAVSDSIIKLERLLMAFDLTDISSDLFMLLDNIQEASSNFSGFITFLKKLAAIIAIKALKLTSTITEALFDMLIAAFDWFWTAINTNIHIPFISAVFEFIGIEDFSILDVICMAPAFMTNLIYHTVEGKSVVSEETLTELLGTDFPLPPEFNTKAKMSAEQNDATAWDNKNYPLSDMEKIKIPQDKKSKNAIMSLRIILSAVSLGDTIFGCVVICEDEQPIADRSPVSSFISIAINVASFGLSMGLGYGYYSPMDYNSYWATKGFNILWFISSALSLIGDLTAIYFICKGAENKNVSGAIKFVGGIASLMSLVFEAISVADANKLDLSKSKITYNGAEYNLNPELLERDRQVFTSEVIGFCCNDAASVLVTVMDMLPGEKPAPALIAACIARAVFGVGSISAHIACLVLTVKKLDTNL